jgi:hypothetical protein
MEKLQIKLVYLKITIQNVGSNLYEKNEIIASTKIDFFQ